MDSFLDCSHGYNLEPPTKRQKRTFAPRKNEDEVMKAKLSAIPSKTMADTKYYVNVWQQWCAHISTERRSYLGSYTPERNIYPSKKTKRRANSLLHLVSGIQFSEFRMSLDVVTYLISCRYSSLYFNISILKIKIFLCYIPKILNIIQMCQKCQVAIPNNREGGVS